MWITTSGSCSANARSTASASRTSTRTIGDAVGHARPPRTATATSGRRRRARRRPRPSTRSHSVSHAPLKPVCPVTSTRRPFQKPGSTLTRASRRSPSSPSSSCRPRRESCARSLDTVTSFTGWSGRNASGPTRPVVLAEPISLPVPGSGLPPPRCTTILWTPGLQVVDAERHVVAGVGLLPLHVADLACRRPSRSPCARRSRAGRSCSRRRPAARPGRSSRPACGSRSPAAGDPAGETKPGSENCTSCGDVA